MKNKRMIVDIAMIIVLPMLMAYSLIGEAFHEAAGTVMLVLFIWHHWLNRAWFKGLFRGKYTPVRTFRTTINLLLLVFMVLQPVSGILMSKHLYLFLPTVISSATSREIHMFLAYWGFLFMSIHVGSHLEGMIHKMKSKVSPIVMRILQAISAVISIYGCYAFVKREIPSYLFLRNAFAFFDYEESKIFFFMDYLSIMFLFGFIGFALIKGLKHISRMSK